MLVLGSAYKNNNNNGCVISSDEAAETPDLLIKNLPDIGIRRPISGRVNGPIIESKRPITDYSWPN